MMGLLRVRVRKMVGAPDKEVALFSSVYDICSLRERSQSPENDAIKDEIDPELHIDIRCTRSPCGALCSCTNPGLKAPRIDRNRVSRSPTLSNSLSITADTIRQQRRRRRHHIPTIAGPLGRPGVNRTKVVGAGAQNAGCGALGVDVCGAAPSVGC